MKIIPSCSTKKTINAEKEVEVNDYHRKLGHLNQESMRNTAKHYNQKLKGKVND